MAKTTWVSGEIPPLTIILGEYMYNLDKAKKILQNNKYTFVLLKDGRRIKTSHKKGIFPFMEMIRDHSDMMEGAVIADKVIGKAAALLAAGYKVKAIYSEVISQKAREVLEYNSIFYQFDYCVDYIKNRDKNDQCPMEKLTENINDPKIAYHQILEHYREVLKMDLS